MMIQASILPRYYCDLDVHNIIKHPYNTHINEIYYSLNSSFPNFKVVLQLLADIADISKPELSYLSPKRDEV